MSSYSNNLVRTARQILGRPAWRRNATDWEAVEAVKAACANAGMDSPLEAWMPRGRGPSLTSLVRAYVTRYAQAYGLDAVPWHGDR